MKLLGLILLTVLAVTFSVQDKERPATFKDGALDIAHLLKDEWGALPDCEATQKGTPDDVKCETWGSLIGRLRAADDEATKIRQQCTEMGYECGRNWHRMWAQHFEPLQEALQVAQKEWALKLVKNKEAVSKRLEEISKMLVAANGE